MQRKSSLYNLFRIAAFLVIGAVLLGVFSQIFDGGYWFRQGYIYDRTARYAAYTAQEPGQIDVITVGDSLSICAITPPELYRDYGITAYNIGQDMQFPVESYYALEHALKTQPVKVVLLETNALFYDNSLVDEAQKDLSEFLQSRFPFLRFHNLWKIPFKRKSIRKYFKGYTINESEGHFDFDKDYTFDNPVRYPIQPQQHLHLMRIQKYCKDHDIRLILYSSASIQGYYTMRKHNTLMDYAEKYGFEVVDANFDKDIVGMDWPNDTWDDGDHLTLSGCRKMTAYLGNYLRSECDLPDHRSDPAYKSWDDMLVEYDEEVEKMKGKSYADVEKELGFPKY